MKQQTQMLSRPDRSYFIGGSDGRVIMGNDEATLLRLWREKRGEVEPEDLSGNLIVQLGVVTEDLPTCPTSHSTVSADTRQRSGARSIRSCLHSMPLTVANHRRDNPVSVAVDGGN